ncbi:MAG: asparagine synthase C-terminal domain-containing protein [Sphingobacteriaceae bacterium]|nr:asparagine synthase C-terminal domain-containing protein [Sphingobacteriaceae bacterium]
MSNGKQLDISHKILYIELKHRLPELLLLRVDKIGMANSIEPRVPFLDYRIVELAFNIPIELKINNGIHKYILKRTAEKILPPEIIYRKKMGFCDSTAKMFTPKLKLFAERIITSETRKLPHLFNQEFIQRSLSENSDASKTWSLLNFALWNKTWF